MNRIDHLPGSVCGQVLGRRDGCRQHLANCGDNSTQSEETFREWNLPLRTAIAQPTVCTAQSSCQCLDSKCVGRAMPGSPVDGDTL